MERKHFALAFLGCLFAGVAFAQEKITITSTSLSFGHAPVYVAKYLGYFEEVGLKVDLVRASSGPNSLAAVLSGDVDMVMGAPATILYARKQGADIVLLAADATQYLANIYVTKDWAEKKNVTLTSTVEQKLEALRGITIGVTSPGGGGEQLVRYLAAAGKINPDREMTITPLGESAAMFAALTNGRIDGISASSPAGQIAVRDFGGMILLKIEAGEVKSLNGYLGDGISARRDWLASHETAAVKFSAALQRAVDTMRNPATTATARDAVHKQTYPTIDDGLFAEIWQDAVAGLPPTLAVNQTMIQSLIDLANQFSRDKLDAAMIGNAFTNEYIEKARTK